MNSRALGICVGALLVAVSPLLAQPQDYEIHGGSQVGRFRVGVPASQAMQILSREGVSDLWRATWGQGKAIYWPRSGINVKV